MEKILRDKKNIMLMILPVFIIYLLFVPLPTLISIVMSFTDWEGLGTPNFVGLENYIKLFTKDRVFQISIINTFEWVFGGLIFQLVPAFVLSLVLTAKIKATNFFRGLIFLPSTFSAVAVSLIFYFVYHPEIGLLNQFIRMLGMSDFSYAWLRDSNFALIGVLIATSWQWIGYYAVLMISSILGISGELIEAARIDGATGPQVIKNILYPFMKPALKVAAVLSVTSAFKGFAFIYVMTQGGPNNATMLMGLHMYNRGFASMKYGYGSAIAVIIMVLSIFFSFIINRIFARESMYD